MRQLRALAGLLLALGCGGRERLETTTQPVYGGAVDTKDTAVVAVVNFAGGQCSGSLITPRLVLTARHCVADTAGQELDVVCGQTAFKAPDSPGAIFVVPQPTISNDPDDYLAVAEIRVPEALGDDLCGTDVVLLRLAEPLLDVTPLEPRLSEPVLAGEPYAAVGYGIDEALADKPAGERKRLDDLAVKCAGRACRDADVRDNEWLGSRGACRGDSGGPALDKQARVIGVVSRGASQCETPIYGDVASRAAWLQSEARAAASAAHELAPSWAPCDDTCASAEPPTDAEPAETCSLGRVRTPGPLAWSCLLVGALIWMRRAKTAPKPNRTSELLRG